MRGRGERVGDAPETRLEAGEIVGLESIEEISPDAVEMGRRRDPEPIEPDRGEDRLLPAGIRRAGHPLDGARRLEAVDQTSDTAPREDHALGQDVHADAPTGRV